jgi:hypothetical protein
MTQRRAYRHPARFLLLVIGTFVAVGSAVALFTLLL